MMIIQLIITIVLFFAIKWFAWNLTERRWGFPPFLEYKPYTCYKCLGFWTLSATFTSVGLLFQAYLLLAVGLLLTALDTVAIIVHEKNNTIKIEDMDKILNE